MTMSIRIFLLQANLKLGKWGLMMGDRFRLSDSDHYNAYTLSAYHHAIAHHPLALRPLRLHLRPHPSA